MTAPKWAMERAEAIIDGLAGLTGEPDELVFQGSLLHQDMAEAIAKAHREGWQAAIEAAKLRDYKIDYHDGTVPGLPRGFHWRAPKKGVPGAYTGGRGPFDTEADARADAVRALLYQPPEDRGDG